MTTTANGPANGPKKIFGRDNINYTPQRAKQATVPYSAFELSHMQNIGDTYSAQIAANYAHKCILEQHMHNGADVGNHLELYYYSSPQGRLELQRRMSGSSIRKEYQRIYDVINNNDIVNDRPITFSEEEKERIEHSIIKGKEMMSSGFSVPHEPHSMDRRRDNHIHHALVNYSHQWMDNLTTKQQESISHLTSDGFIFLQGSLYPDHHDFFRHPSYSSIIDYDTISPDNISNDIMKKKREYSREITETVLDSFDNAPVLDDPVMSYRGTTIEELKDLIGDNEISHQELYDRAVTGEFHNSEVSDDSRIMNIPVSSSAHSDTASSFGGGVLLEIQRHTITSPVNVSAWGPAETEILTNPLSSYTIKDIYLKPSQENRELMVVQLEENI